MGPAGAERGGRAEGSGPGRIVVLTGAGVSAESGLDTFRDLGGVWGRVDPGRVATPEGYAADPDLVHGFYNARRRALAGVAPNPAHIALARLGRAAPARGGALFLVTQNVDDLHERAGSAALHMHGELLKARCCPDSPHGAGCGAVLHWDGDLSTAMPCPACGGRGALRPHVVWFGEVPLGLDRIEAALSEADLFVSVGTSGSVYPAAGFVHAARDMGVPCVELNLEPSENAAAFHDARYGPASEVVPAWVAEVLRSR
ncbi:NAD-dependent deacylase [Rhodobacteraceae bacterium CCMM004]|nr:NAD-dependent deacylase [Rhodobacteraceae bacterium CCMM004]